MTLTNSQDLEKNKPDFIGILQKVGIVWGLIFLLNLVIDWIWINLDHSPPAWDQAHRLTGALNYLNALQNMQIFSLKWWDDFWSLTSKDPPLTYIVTAPFLQLFGRGEAQATLVNILFIALLLFSVYQLGKHLFSPRVGLWAAAFCVVIPGLYRTRVDYLLDYPLTAIVLIGFYALTRWCDAQTLKKQWGWGLLFGVTLGANLLTKQNGVFFLFFPLLWIGIKILWRRRWGRLLQLLVSFLVAIALFYPWYQTNWIFFIGAYTGAFAQGAINEGDPPLDTLEAWTHYFFELPFVLTWVFLLVGVAGLILRGIRSVRSPQKEAFSHPFTLRVAHPLMWLGWYWVGSYFLCSALVNKDSRYVMPYYPVLAIMLAYGLVAFQNRWRWIPWTTWGLTLLLMILNLFPVGGESFAQWLSPNARYHPYRGPLFPNEEIIAEITQTTPYQKGNLGMLMDTPAINHNTMNYYGAVADFQVYAREVGKRQRHLEQDLRSLDWLIAQQNPTYPPDHPRFQIVQQLQQDPNFQVQQRWTLPDNSVIELYHKLPAPITLTPLDSPLDSLRLDEVLVPPVVPPGYPVPITYQWSGDWQSLQSGLVLVTWAALENPSQQWLQDRAIGNGMLHPSPQWADQSFQVRETLAMFPPEDLPPGDYRLSVAYLNPDTGEAHPIPFPPVTITLDPTRPPLPAPALDFVTQLRHLARDLPEGREALDPIFDQIGQMNQYDPIQDYTRQAELTLAYRLSQNPDRLDWAYGLTLARALQEDAVGAIAALEKVVQLDPNNPYAHAYLAVVHLYRWQPRAAQQALNQAAALNPDLWEIQALQGAAAAMQGQFIKAWQVFSALQ
ncbi:glycosyltransferase family 39 protein [Spirulina subsalsa]|uniref:glycosyltransferase family 39 protein n=1 Tax=Spirulina subsalsa TaxID=54311 RepID=UPI0003010DE4|nr:glycosyltransferase family 39 protein [Spirulina subsalsa]